jgi:hypothetical protein
MNSITIPLIVVFLSLRLADAQHILLMKNGETIPFKKLFPFEDHIKIINDKRETITVSHEDLNSYYNTNSRTIEYLIPVTQHRIDGWGLIRKDMVVKMQFSELVLAGKIRLYKTNVVTGVHYPIPTGYRGVVGGGYSETPRYYAEKDDQFDCVYFYTRDRKLHGRDVLSTFLDDDSDILEKFASHEFSFTEKNLLSLVQEYNIRNHDKITPHDYKSVGTIGLYTRADPSLMQRVTLKVNDSIEYHLSSNVRPLPIMIPLNAPTKICAVWNNRTACHVVMPVPFDTQYYELRWIGRKDLFVIESRQSNQVENFLQTRTK